MFLLVLLFSLTTSTVLSKTNEVQFFCPNHNPQKSLDLKLIMGKWYVVEIVDHMAHEGLRSLHEVDLDLCPIVHLHQDDFSNIRISWKEEGETAYYHAKRTDMQSPGFWTASGPHRAFIMEHERHQTYTGTIEVMKAVNNHIVLTFCKSDHSDSQLFSAVLARDTWLSRADTIGVNKMLPSRKLTPRLIKRTCIHGAAAAILPSLILLVVSMVAVL